MPAKEVSRSVLPEIKVVYPPFWSYKSYLLDLQKGMKVNMPPWFITQSPYKDWTPLLQIGMGLLANTEEDLRAMPRSQAVVPMWLSTQFNVSMGDLVFGLQQTLNALKHTERGRPPMVDKVTVPCAYWEGRADHDPHNQANGGYLVGEAINAEVFAKSFGNQDGMGIDELVLLGPHSHEDVEFLTKQAIKVLPVTVAPLFAEHLKTHMSEYNIDPANLQFVALDKGSLQQNLRLCELMGLDPAKYITVYDKARKGENVVEKLKLLYGDPTGKDIVIFDDIIDTYGSMEETVKSLTEIYHCKSITLMVTHGVVSHPARQNIIKGLYKTHSIDRIVLTDSLPKPTYMFEEMSDKIPIIPTAHILGEITQHLIETSYEEMMSADSTYAPFILYPEDKEAVWNKFKVRVGIQ